VSQILITGLLDVLPVLASLPFSLRLALLLIASVVYWIGKLIERQP
jgi:hypothetical protein